MDRKICCVTFTTEYNSCKQRVIISSSIRKILRCNFHRVRSDCIIRVKSRAGDYVTRLHNKWLKSNDPPIPPGAIKFSYSVRVASVKFYLCDTDIDFISIRVRISNPFTRRVHFVKKIGRYEFYDKMDSLFAWT